MVLKKQKKVHNHSGKWSGRQVVEPLDHRVARPQTEALMWGLPRVPLAGWYNLGDIHSYRIEADTQRSKKYVLQPLLLSRVSARA